MCDVYHQLAPRGAVLCEAALDAVRDQVVEPADGEEGRNAPGPDADGQGQGDEQGGRQEEHGDADPEEDEEQGGADREEDGREDEGDEEEKREDREGRLHEEESLKEMDRCKWSVAHKRGGRWAGRPRGKERRQETYEEERALVCIVNALVPGLLARMRRRNAVDVLLGESQHAGRALRKRHGQRVVELDSRGLDEQCEAREEDVMKLEGDLEEPQDVCEIHGGDLVGILELFGHLPLWFEGRAAWAAFNR